MNEVDSMCKNVRSLADDLQVVRECQRHQSQVTHFYFNPQSSTFKSISPPSFFPCPHTHPNWFIILLRLVFTSNEVRLKVRVSKSGVIRPLMTLWQSKIWVVSRVIKYAMESELEESGCFHFFLTSRTTLSLMI